MDFRLVLDVLLVWIALNAIFVGIVVLFGRLRERRIRALVARLESRPRTMRSGTQPGPIREPSGSEASPARPETPARRQASR